MKNNIFGNDITLHKKLIHKRVLCCILSVFSLIVLNVILLIFRNNIGKILSLVINVLLDIIGLSLITFYYDFNVSNELKILKLFNQKAYVEKGLISEISTTTIMYNKLECYIVKINNKKYYTPIQSKIEFVLDRNVVINTVKEIILEVSYE
jgi:hypothetical protein